MREDTSTDGIHIRGRTRIQWKSIHGYVPDIIGWEELAAIYVTLRKGDARCQRYARDDHLAEERTGGELHNAKSSVSYAGAGSRPTAARNCSQDQESELATRVPAKRQSRWSRPSCASQFCELTRFLRSE